MVLKLYSDRKACSLLSHYKPCKQQADASLSWCVRNNFSCSINFEVPTLTCPSLINTFYLNNKRFSFYSRNAPASGVRFLFGLNDKKICLGMCKRFQLWIKEKWDLIESYLGLGKISLLRFLSSHSFWCLSFVVDGYALN